MAQAFIGIYLQLILLISYALRVGPGGATVVAARRACLLEGGSMLSVPILLQPPPTFP